MENNDTLKVLVVEFAHFFDPLIEACRSEQPLFELLSWAQTANIELDELEPLINLVNFLSPMAEQIHLISQSFEPPSAERIDNVLDMLSDVVDFLHHLDDLMPGLGLKIINELTINYLQHYRPRLLGWIDFFGGIDHTNTNPFDIRLNIDSLIETLRDPRTLLNKFGFGEQGIILKVLLAQLKGFLWSFNVPARVEFTPREDLQLFSLLDTPDSPIRELRVPLFIGSSNGAFAEAGFRAIPYVNPLDYSESKLIIVPFGVAAFSEDTELADVWRLRIIGSATSQNAFWIEASPSGIVFKTFEATDSAVDLTLSVRLEGSQIDGVQKQLVNFMDSFKISIQEVGLSIDLYHGEDDDIEIAFLVRKLAIELMPSDADFFVSSLLPRSGIFWHTDIEVGWSLKDGFRFTGSSSLDISLPLHLRLGPCTISSGKLIVDFGRDDSKLIEMTAAADVGAVLGPIKLAIKTIGMKVGVQKINRRIGRSNLSLQLSPSSGVGILIDTTSVVGGGFLEFDHENKRYVGILRLEFKKIGLMAIGLITTKMPDGSKGFSMLMSINVTFDPAISLPYNFKLIGVGGLIGIHRSMIIEVIRQGLRNRTLDSIMFPEDPILNAAKIISDLRAVFPPTEDRFVLGLMAKLGWNSPPLITGDIGILIEIPQPVRIAIIGQLALVLPKKEKAIVTIHLDMIGVVDFAKCLFSFDASLYDSKILTFTLSGDSAMRLSWGEEPNFALSIGGLHPRFKPPPKFPTLRRLRLSIGSGNNPRINFDTYQAITSNSTQFGAKLEVYAKKGKFSIQGYLGFDALFIFSPFSFVVDIGAGVSVKAGSKTLFTISLDLMLAGTSPWRAKGKATFKILFVKIKIRFDKSWGQRKKVSLPAVDPTEQLRAALSDPGNWAGILPAESQMGVSLRKSEEKTDAIIVHPMGRLEIRQRVLPLGVRLEKFGNAPVTGPGRYTIDKVKTGTEKSLNLTPVKDHFARGQFEDISDAKKVSSPSFEKFDAGVRAGSDRITFENPVSYTLEYETEVIDENRVTHKLDPSKFLYDPSKLPWWMGRYLMAGSAARLGVMRNAGSRKYTVFGKTAKVRMQEEAYVIAGMKDMKAEQGIPHNDIGMTYSQAKQAYDEHVRNNPDKQGNVQIILKQEVAA